MNRGQVYVEIGSEEIPIRIFRGHGASVAYAGTNRISVWPKKDAVEAIRRQCFKRSNGYCEWCGEAVTWYGFHMHEKVFRGKGGDVSVENSVAICADCHINRPDSAHGNRKIFSRN